MTNLDYLYNKKLAQEFFAKDCFVDRRLHFRIIPRGTILPNNFFFVNGKFVDGLGGIVDEKGEYIKSSSVYYDLGEAYTPNEEVEYVPKSVVYMGLLCGVWGHSITDSLRRLWFLRSRVFNRYFKDCTPVYISYGNVDLLNGVPNFKKILDILEIDIGGFEQIRRPMQFENIILPDESFFGSGEERLFTEEYRETIDRVRDFALKNKTPVPSKKVYFFYGRKQVGENRLAEYFRSKGYEILQPWNLTLEEQLNWLINAESFASTVGSCSHNAIFLRDGTEVILIPRAADRFTGYQRTLDQIHELNINYVDSTLSTLFKAGVEADYCFIISEQLKKFFGDEFDGYTEEDFKTYLSYVRLCRTKGFKENPDTFPYYAPLMQKFYPQLQGRKDLLEAYKIVMS